MDLPGDWRRRLVVLLKRQRFDEDLAREIEFHLDEKQEEFIEQCLDARQARDAARRRFGNATRVQEESREVWGWSALERVGQDLSYAFRQLRRSPIYTATCLAVLALGIGANVAIFTIVNALVLNPFPYPGADRLAAIEFRRGPGEGFYNTVHVRDFLEWRAGSRAFERMAAYGWGRANLTGQSLAGFWGPERLIRGRATAGFLRVLGVQPALGRYFAPDEDRPGGPPVVVISHAMWTRRFARAREVIGATLTLDGQARTIIGVMPARLPLPGMFTCELWIPAAYDPATTRGTFWDGDHVIGRLKDGVSFAKAETELTTITRQSQAREADTRRADVRVVPVHADLGTAATRPLGVLSVAVLLVLLVACVNLAGLQLARGAARAREMAVRASLGAGRLRLGRQMLTESLVLSSIGGALGILLATWATGALATAAPPSSGLTGAVRIDAPVVAFAAGVTLVTALLFGLFPAWHGSKVELSAVLKASATTSTDRSRFLSGLVVCEIALAVVLLAAGGLLLKSFVQLLRVDTGIRTDRLLTFQVALPDRRYPTSHAVDAFFGRLFDGVRALPGVVQVASVDALPMGGQYSGSSFTIDGVPQTPQMRSQYCTATGGYFETMGIPVLRGREFADREPAGAPGVVIINNAFARQFFPGADPLGRAVNGARIVGVVGSVRHNGPASQANAQIYVPAAFRPARTMSVVVRTAVDPSSMAPLVRSALATLDRDVPADRMRTMTQVVADSLAQARMTGVLVGGFAAFALALAAFGLYGLVAYAVARRTQEIGLRMALGASAGAVTRLVIRHGVTLAVAGIALGLPLSLAASQALRSLLVGVRPDDAQILILVPVTLLGVAVLASYWPARLAARVDPIQSLRCE